MKWILFVCFLIASCRHVKQEYPLYEIYPNGDEMTLEWKHSKGTDIKGYEVYYRESNNYSWSKLDVGYTTGYNFKIDPETTYKFYMKSYDNRKTNRSDAGKIKTIYGNRDRSNFRSLDIGYELMLDDPWEGHMYNTHADITLGWTHDGINMTHFELKAEFVNDPSHVTSYDLGSVDSIARNMTITRPPNVGLYVFYIRACRDTLCSIWVCSDDEEFASVTVDGTTMPANWRVYWKLAPPVWE